MRLAYFSIDSWSEEGDSRVDAFSEYVPETGRFLDGHGRLSVSILDEQARAGAAADIRLSPSS